MFIKVDIFLPRDIYLPQEKNLKHCEVKREKKIQCKGGHFA